MFRMNLFSFVYYVFLLFRMFLSRYCVSLCRSVYCLCVNVYCTTATGCPPNCSCQICRKTRVWKYLRFFHGEYKYCSFLKNWRRVNLYIVTNVLERYCLHLHTCWGSLLLRYISKYSASHPASTQSYQPLCCNFTLKYIFPWSLHLSVPRVTS
jgi:hypothetical protein